MKKQIVAFMSAALIALAAPVAAHAWESPSGAVKAETITVTTESGVNVRAAAACQVLHGLISIIFSDFCNVFGPFP